MVLRKVHLADNNGGKQTVLMYHNGKLRRLYFTTDLTFEINDYEYTLDENNNVSLNKYIGAGGDIDIPEVRE